MLALDLPPEIERRLDALARRTGRSADDHVREAIQDHLDEIEDVELAESRVAALKSGESRTVTLQAVMDRHGLPD
ncbi:ribbon-helix-helix protein, CopG family [Methylobacterium sp. E-025]|uniref:type II toxin-antitoxin system RelB family antitoxin n=1 Tax=Methylobacterium sp. E-025 TaxID=2836561 RepID=UPI001FB9CB10|nr:TraY domain-containing protein [Methylobacterium sp. E-025]MCJ2113888.1 ribbon-helix-helix protein, CopG family [Methylobacterium sp. E-025]